MKRLTLLTLFCLCGMAAMGQDITQKATRGSFFVMPGASYGRTHSYSLMAGYVKDWGGYVRYKSNLASKGEVGTGVKDAFYDDSFAKLGRTSYNAGVMKKMFNRVYFYAGLGYGSSWVQWKTAEKKTIVEIEDLSFSGVDPEIGAIYRYGVLVVGVGGNMLIGKKLIPEANLSVGIAF